MTDGAGGPERRSPLGILACAGPLPIEVAEAASRQGRPVHIVAIDGFAGEAVARFPHERVSLGEVGRILASFRRAGAREIVIAGAMQRPDLLRLKIDWGFLANLPTVLSLTRGGDDSVLRRIVRFFELNGLRVVGAAEVAPELLAPAGSIAGERPGTDQAEAASRAVRLITDLGPFDIGQGAVALADRIVAVEGARGTDAMLRDLGPGGIGEGLGRGAVLVKLAKPGQEMRIDLPTIGPETVRRARAAGLAGIAVGADGTIVLERGEVAREAVASGLRVWGLERGSASEQSAAPAFEPAAGDEVPLAVAARRAPTPADRRDVVIGRRLVALLRQHGAGEAALVSREHVLAISGRLPLAAFVGVQGRPASWGRRALRRRLGVLLLDGQGADPRAGPLDAPLFRAAMATGLAGIVWLGALPEDEERRREILGWADEAGVFLMMHGRAP